MCWQLAIEAPGPRDLAHYFGLDLGCTLYGPDREESESRSQVVTTSIMALRVVKFSSAICWNFIE